MNGARLLPAILNSHRPLDLVIFLLGTNDCKARFSPTAESITAGICRLIEMTRREAVGRGGAAPAMLVVSPPPMPSQVGALSPSFVGAAAVSARLADAYRSACRERGVEFFDAGRVIRSSEVDGVHWSSEAQVRLGEALAEPVLRLEWP